jgi:uncharacterized protein (TIGR00369 family)
MIDDHSASFGSRERAMTERLFVAVDPGFADRIRASFARQALMRLLDASIDDVAPGRCTIALPYRDDLTQQHGYIHGGVVGAIADSAGGYAGYTLMPTGTGVLTVEFKVNLLAPARGERLLARGEVVRPGRSLFVTRADVYALAQGRETHVASMQQTLMVMPGLDDLD